MIERQWVGRSEYNALQTSLNRALRNGFAFSASYTLSKSEDLGTGLSSRLPTYLDADAWLWDLSDFDQTHVLTATSTWNLPGLSRVAGGNRFVKAVFDDWAVTGFLTMASGQPRGITFTTTNSADLTGGGDGQRVNIVGDLQLPYGDRTFARWFAVENVRLPERGDVGNASRNPVRLPGQRNVDMSLSKRFPFGPGGRHAEFRWEIYNVFNSFQYDGLDLAARFDPQGNQVNSRFGQVTSARPPRIMQAALRLVF